MNLPASPAARLFLSLPYFPWTGGLGQLAGTLVFAPEDMNLQRLFTLTLVLETRDYSIIY